LAYYFKNATLEKKKKLKTKKKKKEKEKRKNICTRLGLAKLHTQHGLCTLAIRDWLFLFVTRGGWATPK